MDASAANPLAPVTINLAPGPQYATAQRQFQGIPGVALAPSGRLWATWYSGGVGEGPDNFVLLVTSADGGRSWSEPVAVVDPPGQVRAYDPVVWCDPAGRLWWFWAQVRSLAIGNISDGRAGVWAVCAENADAARPAFTPPRRIANGVMMNKPTVLASGDWALPTAVWDYGNPVVEELKGERFSNILVSADRGASFQLRGGADVPHRCFDEHMIIERRDGSLWMLVRTLYGIGQSSSADQGRTWSPGENSGLGGPNSRFFIRRLTSGRLLLVNHADVPPDSAVARFLAGQAWRPRSHLTAFLSGDDGRSWQGGLTLDERAGVSYPDGVQAPDGLIHVVYDHERHRRGAILMATFREEDVLARRPVSPDTRLQQLVNETGGVRR